MLARQRRVLWCGLPDAWKLDVAAHQDVFVLTLIRTRARCCGPKLSGPCQRIGHHLGQHSLSPAMLGVITARVIPALPVLIETSSRSGLSAISY